MGGLPLALVVLLAAGSALAAPPRFVDPGAPAGGDGSPERPFRRLEEALRPGAEVRLRPGRYAGPWVLPAGVTLQGAAGVVLEAADGSDRPGVLLDTRGDANLSGLELRGGTVALRLRGATTLQDVTLLGATEAGLELLAGKLDATRLRLVTPTRAAAGVRIGRGTRATLRHVRTDGPFGRAVEVSRAQLTLEDAELNGAIVALHAEEAVLQASRLAILDPGVFARPPSREAPRHVTVDGGNNHAPTPPGASRTAGKREGGVTAVSPGAGIFVAGGVGALTDVFITGHEYGLLTRNAQLRVTRFGSLRARRSAIGIVGGVLDASAVVLARPGPFGAIQVSGGRSRVAGLVVTGWSEQAVWLRGGSLHLSAAAIVNPAPGEDGHPLSARVGAVTADHLRVQGAPGACLYVSGGGELRARAALLDACTWGIAADGDASIRVAGGMVGASEAAIVAVAGGQVTTFDVTALPGRVRTIDADCASGARVVAFGLRAGVGAPGTGPSDAPVKDCIVRSR